MTHICCIGHITRDRIITQNPPNTVHCAGGSAYYMAWAFQALPHDVGFHLVTAVSHEVMPEVEKLREAGIPVTAFDSPDNVFFDYKYGVNMDHRTQRVLARSATFTIDQLKDVEARVFHLGSLMADDFAPEVVEYLATKGRVCVDVQGYLREVRNQRVYAVDWVDKLRVLKHTDILKVNEYEIDVLTDGERDLKRGAKLISSWGLREVLVTLGSYGSLIYADNHFYEIPSYDPQQVVDATGWGDTSAHGYLYARAHGADCEEAGRLAAAMCTLKLEHTGPFDATIDDARRIVAKGGI